MKITKQFALLVSLAVVTVVSAANDGDDNHQNLRLGTGGNGGGRILGNGNGNNGNGNNGNGNNGNGNNGNGNNGNGNNGNGKKPKFFKAKKNGIKDQYIVVFKDTVKPEDVDYLSENVAKSNNGKKKGKAFKNALRGFTAEVSEEDAIVIAQRDDVKYVEQDATVTLDAATWGLDRIDQRDLPLDGAYKPIVDSGTDGTGVAAYIIDTGIRTTHTEFGGRATWGINTAGDGRNYDCDGHGTHVAGTVGGTAYGVAKNVNLVAVKVLDCDGYGTYSSVLEGIEWVTNNRVDPAVANMSLGGDYSFALNDAVAASVDAGIVYAVAAGNEETDACTKSPASEPKAITVGSTTDTDARSWFSNYGTCVDIFAPGSSITSAWNGGDDSINTVSGTSMASPHVCGMAALMLAADPSLSTTAVDGLIKAQATPGKISNRGRYSPNLLLAAIPCTVPEDCGTGFECLQGSCSDIDECNVEMDNCIEGAICTNTVGGFECSCSSACDNGAFCDGDETCNSFGECELGSPPCNQLCDENNDRCVQCLDDGDCLDGEECNTPSGECVELFCSIHGRKDCKRDGRCRWKRRFSSCLSN